MGWRKNRGGGYYPQFQSNRSRRKSKNHTDGDDQQCIMQSRTSLHMGDAAVKYETKSKVLIYLGLTQSANSIVPQKQWRGNLLERR